MANWRYNPITGRDPPWGTHQSQDGVWYRSWQLVEIFVAPWCPKKKTNSRDRFCEFKDFRWKISCFFFRICFKRVRKVCLTAKYVADLAVGKGDPLFFRGAIWWRGWHSDHHHVRFSNAGVFRCKCFWIMRVDHSESSCSPTKVQIVIDLLVFVVTYLGVAETM